MALFIDNGGNNDPAVNLALEEYCLKHLPPDRRIVMLSVNDPAVVVGKHQCVFAEADLVLTRRRGIRVVRRMSGGGAVYHDRGNLNFSIIGPYDAGRFGNYPAMLRPVIDTLAEIGVSVFMGAKSDLVIAGLKVSGNAQYADMRRMLCHGTLLFDADVACLHAALRPTADVIDARGVPSIRSTVTRIRDHLPADMTMADFVDAVGRGLKKHTAVTEIVSPTPGEWETVNRIAEDKYRRWSWNIGQSPRCRLRCRVPERREVLREWIVEVVKGNIARIEGAESWDIASPLIGQRVDALIDVMAPPA